MQSLPARVPRLDSIRNRILALAVLGTLIPAAITLSFAERRISDHRDGLFSQLTGHFGGRVRGGVAGGAEPSVR